MRSVQAADGSRFLQESPVLICIIAALIVMIGVFAIITTAPVAPQELAFGEIPG